MTREKKKQKGFTLIEVIVTIIISALVGLVVFVYLGTALTRSHEPIGQVRDLGEAMAVMEGFTSEYNRYLRSGGTVTWGEFKALLTGEGVTYENVATEQPFATLDPGFEILKVTVTRDSQKIFSLFTEFYIEASP